MQGFWLKGTPVAKITLARTAMPAAPRIARMVSYDGRVMVLRFLFRSQDARSIRHRGLRALHSEGVK